MRRSRAPPRAPPRQSPPDSKMRREYGKPSPNVISGSNMPTRVPLTDSVKPGQTIQVAVYGINGLLSAPASNRIFIREARIDFVR